MSRRTAWSAESCSTKLSSRLRQLQPDSPQHEPAIRANSKSIFELTKHDPALHPPSIQQFNSTLKRHRDVQCAFACAPEIFDSGQLVFANSGSSTKSLLNAVVGTPPPFAIAVPCCLRLRCPCRRVRSSGSPRNLRKPINPATLTTIFRGSAYGTLAVILRNLAKLSSRPRSASKHLKLILLALTHERR